jgi:hypothetical protein
MNKTASGRPLMGISERAREARLLQRTLTYRLGFAADAINLPNNWTQ